MSHSLVRSEPLRDQDEDVDYGSLLTQFASHDLSRHLALFYQSDSEQVPVAAAYVARGLERNERCLYIADEHDPETIVESFRERGIDVDEHRESGQLVVENAAEIYVGDEFEPDETVQALVDRVDEGLAEGFEGFRVAGENTWCFHLESAFDDVLEFETLFDERCPDFEVTALCQYDVGRFSDAAVGKALQTHEQIIYRGRIVSNPYYVPPNEFRESNQPKTNAELLLDQTLDVAGFRSDVKQREQRLSVVNRVLRHNLRNELNVALGRLQWLRKQGFVAAEGMEHLETIETVIERLVELSDQARHVDQTLDTIGHGSEDIRDIVAKAVEQVERESDSTIDVETNVEATTVDGVFRPALSELLTVACADETASTPTVTLDCHRESSLVSIEVRGKKPLVPEQSRKAITREFEEALEHSFGLRMWVAKWVVESANGNLSVAVDDEEEIITIDLPVIGPSDEV